MTQFFVVSLVSVKKGGLGGGEARSMDEIRRVMSEMAIVFVVVVWLLLVLLLLLLLLFFCCCFCSCFCCCFCCLGCFCF